MLREESRGNSPQTLATYRCENQTIKKAEHLRTVAFYSLGFLSLAHVRFLYRLLLCFLVNVGGISEPQPRS